MDSTRECTSASLYGDSNCGAVVFSKTYHLQVSLRVIEYIYTVHGLCTVELRKRTRWDNINSAVVFFVERLSFLRRFKMY